MDKRKKLEKYILNEFQAVDNKTFLYQLHEDCFFNKKKFSKLLTKCNSLTKEYCEFGKSNNYNEVVTSIFAIFQYTFFALFNHFAENDIFIISNYGKDLTPSDVSKYYFQISEITKKIIL